MRTILSSRVSLYITLSNNSVKILRALLLILPKSYKYLCKLRKDEHQNKQFSVPKAPNIKDIVTKILDYGINVRCYKRDLKKFQWIRLERRKSIRLEGKKDDLNSYFFHPRTHNRTISKFNISIE